MYSKIYAHLSNIHWSGAPPMAVIPKEKKVSLCCGAYPPGGTVELNSTGRCPLCGDNCEFVSEDEFKELNKSAPVVVDADLPDEQKWKYYFNRLEQSLHQERPEDAQDFL